MAKKILIGVIALIGLYLLSVGCSTAPPIQQADPVLPAHNADTVKQLVLTPPVGGWPAAVHPGETVDIVYKITVDNQTQLVKREISILTTPPITVNPPDAAPHDYKESGQGTQKKWTYTETTPVTIPLEAEPGIYDLQVRAMQPADGTEWDDTLLHPNGVKILPPETPPDTTPPEISIDVPIPDGQNGWFITNPVEVAFTVDDTDTGNSNIVIVNCWINGSPALCDLVGLGTPTVTGTLDVAYEGINNISITAADEAGNNAGDPNTPIAEVKIDTMAPVVTVNIPIPDGQNGWFVTKPVEVTFTADDPTPGSGIASIDPPGPLSISDEGITDISCTATDYAGNEGTGVGQVKIDTIAPVVTVDIPTPDGQNGWFVTKPVEVTLTADDPTPGSGIASIDPPGPLSISDEGITDISCTATDYAGNEGTGVGQVKIDTIPPEINIISPVNEGIYILHQVVASDYTCWDATSGVSTCDGTVPSGANFDTSIPGLNQFTVNSSDLAGNNAELTHNYYIHYVFNGFLPPITNWPSSPGLFKLGSTVPVKCQLFDANGVSVGDTMGLTPIQDILFVHYYNNEPQGDPIEATATGNTGLRYDSTAQQYIFNWSTKGLVKGFFQFQLVLDDGTTQAVVISLK